MNGASRTSSAKSAKAIAQEAQRRIMENLGAAGADGDREMAMFLYDDPPSASSSGRSSSQPLSQPSHATPSFVRTHRVQDDFRLADEDDDIASFLQDEPPMRKGFTTPAAVKEQPVSSTPNADGTPLAPNFDDVKGMDTFDRFSSFTERHRIRPLNYDTMACNGAVTHGIPTSGTVPNWASPVPARTGTGPRSQRRRDPRKLGGLQHRAIPADCVARARPRVRRVRTPRHATPRHARADARAQL